MKRIFIPLHIRFLVRVYLMGMVFFTLFRILLFLNNLDRLSALPSPHVSLIFRSFLMGLRFDTVISGYILIIPFLALSVFSFFRNRNNEWVFKIVTLYTGILYSMAFLICSVDVPYFNHFFSRISTGIFAWVNSLNFVFKMVFQEVRYWIFIIPFILSCVLFWFFLLGIRNKIQRQKKSLSGISRFHQLVNGIAFFIIFFILLFIGIRGRLAVKSPIRVGTAYFSAYGFPNQLGLNPAFTLMRSILDDRADNNRDPDFMDDGRSLEQVRSYFNIRESDPKDSPIARRVVSDGEPLRANVILVIMESMSADLMERFGNTRRLTPNLDRLAGKSYVFDNIYTSGTHTYSGIYSSLFAYPVWRRRNPLKGASMMVYSGLPNTLKKRGYQIIYFTTHDDQFDNIGGFLRTNGVDRIVSEDDYPSEKVLSTLGVPDDYMFEFSIPRLNRLSREGRPFFAVFLSASNHQPFIIPDDIPFRPRSRKLKHRIVEYADWALGKFMKLASRQEWYANTIFVFIADSGSHVRNSYDLPLSFFHTPLIIHAPHILKEARRFTRIGGQIDVFPTIMGLLNLSYVNNTFGIDLIKERRPFIYFCSDDKVGCLNHEYFLVIRSEENESLYHYRSLDPRDHISSRKVLAAEMKTYCLSMLQASQWMLENRKVGPVL
jgi:phosphoglycerol transferase MdoB-like AlkP superfamily enzyme